MKISSWMQLGAAVLMVGLLAGCGSQGTSPDTQALENDIAQLRSQVQALQAEINNIPSASEIEQLRSMLENPGNGTGSTPVATGGSLRIGFVNAEEVFVKYKGTEDAIQRYRLEKEGKEEELRVLQDQFSAGTISQNEYLTKRTELESTLQNLDQELTNEITQKIVEAVEKIGSELDYDLVTVRKNVVLYYKEDGIVEDLTERVLQGMNEAFENSGGS